MVALFSIALVLGLACTHASAECAKTHSYVGFTVSASERKR